ncbi:expressed unknown protein [Seminavis robusta]|nr:expressed unknown protein [Seminavis robusta]|eukprot:Sro2398_g326160.1 n/a (311) ;mRNA; r:13102-14034
MALAVLAQFDDGVDEVPERVLDRALATIQSSDIGLDSLKDEVAGCLLGDLSSYVMEEVFKDETAGQPKDQQQLFQLVNMWYEHSTIDQVSARELVLDHFCLERMDPVFLSSSLVMTSDLVDQDMLLEAFRSQAVAAQKQYGMIPPVARLAFWKRSLSTFTQAKEGHCMDVLEYPADKTQKRMKLRWTIQVLDDGANSLCVGVAFWCQKTRRPAVFGGKHRVFAFRSDGMVMACERLQHKSRISFPSGSTVTMTLHLPDEVAGVALLKASVYGTCASMKILFLAEEPNMELLPFVAMDAPGHVQLVRIERF